MKGILQTEGGLVINRPGFLMLIPINADGTLDYVNALRNTAKINTINITNSKTKTDIPDGNNFYAAGDRVTAISGTVAVEFSTVDPAIWARCSGSDIVLNEEDTMIRMFEYDKIPESKVLEFNEKYKTDAFVKVVGADGTEFEKVTDAEPQAGEFKIEVLEDKTKVTFAEADVGKSAAVSMTVVTATMSYSQGKNAMRNHKLVIDTEFSTLKNTDVIPVNFEVSQASISGDMVESLQKDPSALKTLTFNMYAPLPGEQPYTVKMKNK